jgi:tetratricopeptide (TPR) repeat protein
MRVSVPVLVTSMLLLLTADASCGVALRSDVGDIVARMRERSAPITTLSATIVGEEVSQPGKISQVKLEIKRPARYRVEASPFGNGDRITSAVLNEATFWKLHPRLGEARRSDAPDFPVWFNEVGTFFGIHLAPEMFLKEPLQLTVDGPDRVDGVEVFVLRVVEPPPELNDPQVRHPLSRLICRVGAAEFGLRSMEVDYGGGVAAQVVVKRWEQLESGFSLPVELELTYTRNKRTIQYRVHDIHVNEAIPDARFEVQIGENLLVRDVKPLSDQAYKSKIEAEPNNPHLHYNLGLLYLRARSNLDEAEKALKRTISLRPRAKPGYARLCSLYQLLNREDEAVQILETAVGLFPDDASFHASLSHQYESAGEYDLAVRELAKKLKLSPDPVADKGRMARLVERTGDFEGAARLYREILGSDLPPSDPRKTSAASELVKMYERAARLEELERKYRQIVEGETVDVLSLKTLADIYLASGKREEAVSVWKRLSAKAGAEDGKLLLALASSFSRNEMFVEAEQVCKQIIGSTSDEYVLQDARRQLASARRPPDREDQLPAYYEQELAANIGLNEWWKAANWLMKYYEQRNELGEFVDKLTALAEKHPEQSSICTALVRAHKQNNDYLGAIAAYKKAIEIDPRNLNFRHKLAETYEEAGLYDEAIASYRDLIQSRPDYSYWYHSLVKLQYRLGKPDDAQRTIEEAMRSVPKDVQWYTAIAAMYGSVEDYKKAESLYLKAVELAPEVGFTHCGMDDGPGQGSKPMLRLQLAHRYREWGEFGKAEEQYRRVIANATGEWFRRSVVGSLVEMYRATGSLDEAIQKQERVLSKLKSKLESTKSASAATARNEETKRENAKHELVEHSIFLALLYREIEKPKEAATVYERVVEVLPEDSDAWGRFVEACEKAELHDKAIVGYAKLLELAPDKKEEYFAELAKLHALLGNKTESVDLTEKLLALRADDEFAHSRAAGMYRWNEVHEKAAEHYLQAIEHTQDFRRKADYRLSLARTYREMEEYDLAKEVYETLLSTPGPDATKQRAREELHHVLEKMSRTSEAIEQADERVRSLREKRTSLLDGIGELEGSKQKDGDTELEIARLKRELAEIQDELTREYELLAATYERQQDVGKAIETLEGLLQILPEEQQAKRLYLFQRVAFAYMRAEDGEKAVEYAKKAVEEEPDVAHWHNGLAQAYEHNEMYAEAASEYKKAAELTEDPRLALQNRLRLARTYSMMTEYDLAEEEYKRIIEEGTETFVVNQARHGLLNLYEQQGKLEQETATVEATLDALESKNFELYKQVAEDYIAAEEHDKAAEILRKAVSIVPDDAGLCMELAALLRKAGLDEETLALYEKVVEIAPESRDARKAAKGIVRLKRDLKQQ